MAEDRVALVTGAGRGIGAGIAQALLEAGLRVVVTDVDEAALAEFEERVGVLRSRVLPVVMDVADPAGWRAAEGQAHQAFSRVDVLVNNAAVSPKHDGVKLPTHRVSLEEWTRVIDVNLRGAFLGVQTFVPGMVERGWGRIVQVSSQAARTGARVASVAYGTSKAGLLGLTRTVAHEYGPAGVTSNAITPGRIRTPMAEGVDPEVNEAMRRQVPVGRLGEPAEIGSTVVFLASEQAGYVNGATIDVNGGSWMG